MLAILALSCAGEVRERDAGSDGAPPTSDESDDDARIVPEGLSVSALPGGNGVLEVFALTLRKEGNSSALYAALRNVGDVPACSAALSIELYDEQGQSLAAGIDGLLTQHFYRRSDGSNAVAACVAPGDVTIAAITDLPAELVIEEVGTVVYRCPYFALDVDPIAGLSIEAVKVVHEGAEATYSGALRNGLDVAITDPSVTIFPVNRVGRPLGVAIARGELEISPHGTWSFQTAALATTASAFLAYPAGALKD